MKLLIKFPSRGRPGKFMKVFNMYRNMLSGKRDVSFLLSFDEDDVTMNNQGIRNWLNKLGSNVYHHFGHSKTKIQACNADLDKAPNFDIIMLASDDMIPVQEGYDDIICSDMEKYFPNTDGVLWYNDGLVGKYLNTLSIIGKKYFDRFGYIYNPVYESVFPDNEFMEVSLMLGKTQYIDRVIIQHQWVGNTDPNDPLHIKNHNSNYYRTDGKIFLKRRLEKFGLKDEEIKYKLSFRKNITPKDAELEENRSIMRDLTILESMESVE